MKFQFAQVHSLNPFVVEFPNRTFMAVDHGEFPNLAVGAVVEVITDAIEVRIAPDDRRTTRPYCEVVRPLPPWVTHPFVCQQCGEGYTFHDARRLNWDHLPASCPKCICYECGALGPHTCPAQD